MKTAKRYKSSEAANKLNISPSYVRKISDLIDLQPVRTPGGQRLFSESDLAAIKDYMDGNRKEDLDESVGVIRVSQKVSGTLPLVITSALILIFLMPIIMYGSMKATIYQDLLIKANEERQILVTQRLQELTREHNIVQINAANGTVSVGESDNRLEPLMIVKTDKTFVGQRVSAEAGQFERDSISAMHSDLLLQDNKCNNGMMAQVKPSGVINLTACEQG